MNHHYKVIIIGSGFGGILAAINLKERQIDDFLILERRAFMGGTWCQNTYPGAAVDVQSPLYSLSSEPYDWSQMFVEQSELAEYTNYVIDKHRLREKCQPSSNVIRIEWHAPLCRWNIYVDGQAEPYVAQFVINASGPLSTPVIPRIKGQEKFKGKSFHTNNWDHDVDYKGARVAIIGSGASAAQVIPAIAKDVEHLSIFQRTPHWVIPRPDHRFTPWQRRLLKNKWAYNILRKAIYWALEFRVVGFKYSPLAVELLAGRKARKHIAQQIDDPNLRQRVTPNFVIGCKRVIISNDLYPAYQRDNVTLFDRNNGIKEITENGVITQDNQEHQLDLLIYATGFDATDGVISYPVSGQQNTLLSDVWRDYPRAYLGTCVPHFPNLFIVTGPNTGIGHTSAIVIIESQMRYIMQCIEHVQQQNADGIEVTVQAESDYTKLIHEEMKKTIWHTGGCNSWYKSKSGKVIAMFPGFSFTFDRWARHFRSSAHRFLYRSVVKDNHGSPTS